MTLSVVILAAGQGKRMRSELPKVLHRLAGKPLLEHVIHTIRTLNESLVPHVIYGHQGDQVQQALSHHAIHWVHQSEQLGTAHAVLQALPNIPDHHRVLVLYGDVPLISFATLKKFIAETSPHAIGMLTAIVNDPKGLGRIIRNSQQQITAIVEEKDATDEQRLLSEINSGIYLLPVDYLKKRLPELNNSNAQKEYYLTDIIACAFQDNIAIQSMLVSNQEEILGVNDKLQLSQLERHYQRQRATELMQAGITIMDPQRIDIRGELSIDTDTTVDVNVIFEGQVTIGKHCSIGPNSYLRDVTLGDHVQIKANSYIEGAQIAAGCVIGPFARIRPTTVLAEQTHIGNFVEIKNSMIGFTTKINHLSYVGDSDIGSKVNIGAGTITCNYDGANKHRTTIKNNVFIGSNSQLIAPVTIGEGATIGAGSTITRHAPANQLTLCRATQRSIANWQRPIKKED
jgi:bifunctional UDP-N-acetylglucosamine pyrophosphorylase/glucosamine-1-phosphate N-acetyltransferase